MIFNSLAFAIFLPIVFAIHWALPHRYRWIVLLIASYYFYMSWNPKYVVLILFTTFVSWWAGIALEKSKEEEKKRKEILTITLVASLGVLFIFKYFNFFSTSIANVFGIFAVQIHPVTLNVLLPVGISFYTFQTLSYVIDVYRGEAEAEHSFGVYATFISFFPQLVAGPIERTNNLLPQIKNEKKFDYDLAMCGARQMLWGFYKKIAVADVVAVYVDKAYENLQRCTGFDLAVAIFFFTIQIYCDFSGYSDIAVGTAKLFGINMMENFKSPYFAKSIKEFWARWHISLSTWFRDYVYIPLGGNRCSEWRCNCNLMITFLVSGLWHGASWTYVIWGAIHGVGQVIEKLFKRKKGENKAITNWLSILCVFLFGNFTWIFFRAETIADAWYVIKNLFAYIATPRMFMCSNLGIGKKNLLYIFMTIIIVVIYDYYSLKYDVIETIRRKSGKILLVAEYVLVLFIGIALYTSTGSNSFVYFQF